MRLRRVRQDVDERERRAKPPRPPRRHSTAPAGSSARRAARTASPTASPTRSGQSVRGAETGRPDRDVRLRATDRDARGSGSQGAGSSCPDEPIASSSVSTRGAAAAVRSCDHVRAGLLGGTPHAVGEGPTPSVRGRSDPPFSASPMSGPPLETAVAPACRPRAPPPHRSLRRAPRAGPGGGRGDVPGTRPRPRRPPTGVWTDTHAPGSAKAGRVPYFSTASRSRDTPRPGPEGMSRQPSSSSRQPPSTSSST